MSKLTEPQQEWVDALRSGEYEQGQFVLHNITRNTWCCLGVACDLYNKRFPGELEISQDDAGEVSWQTYDGHGAALPSKVAAWIGLQTCTGSVESLETSLTSLNDAEYYSFDQIADLIESKPEGLFSA